MVKLLNKLKTYLDKKRFFISKQGVMFLNLEDFYTKSFFKEDVFYRCQK